MYGVELMYLIQFSYYSLIAIDAYCIPLRGLTGLRYSSGAFSIIDTLQQSVILSNYSSLGIKSNFFSNVNILLVPVLVLPILYLPFKIRGDKNTNPRVKPRLLKYGKSLLLEVPLTILLFNSFNIYTSLVVHIESLGSSNVPLLLVSIVCALLLPAYSVLFLKFNDHFV